jgi:hypothetical protein
MTSNLDTRGLATRRRNLEWHAIAPKLGSFRWRLRLYSARHGLVTADREHWQQSVSAHGGVQSHEVGSQLLQQNVEALGGVISSASTIDGSSWIGFQLFIFCDWSLESSKPKRTLGLQSGTYVLSESYAEGQGIGSAATSACISGKFAVSIHCGS